MNTISNIQKFLQTVDAKERFKNSIYDIIENYSVQGNIFASDCNGNVIEAMTGYFVEEKEYSNLNECVKDMNINKQAVRVVENKFVLGTLERQLSSCNETKKVIDVQYLQYVRE